MSRKDEVLESLKSIAIAGLPLILSPQGSALLTLANECFNSSGKLRQNKWNAEIANKIANLDKEMEQKIRETSNFASILASAQRSALEDIEEDKVRLYANVVINAIKNENIDNTKTHIFLNMLRDFSLLHIEILKSLSIKKNIRYSLGINESYKNWKKYIEDIYPMLLNDEELFDIVYSDLSSKKMVKNTYIVYGYDNIDKQTTSLADDFLAFISEQEAKND